MTKNITYPHTRVVMIEQGLKRSMFTGLGLKGIYGPHEVGGPNQVNKLEHVHVVEVGPMGSGPCRQTDRHE